jgi:PKD domain
VVQSAYRPAGGAWTTTGDISARDRNAEEPDVGVDAAGAAVAIWRRHDGSKYVVQSAVKPAGGQWASPVDISDAGENAEGPELAVGPGGEAVAVWSRFNGTRDIVQAAIRPSGGPWQPAVDLSAAGQNAREAQVAIDPSGNAVAVWSRFDGAKYIVQGARRPAGGGWEPALDISASGQNAEAPQVAIDAAGAAVAVWARSDGVDPIVQAAVKGPVGPWAGHVDLSAPGDFSSEPQVAVDPAGTAVATWARDNSPTRRIEAAVRPAGGGWQPSVPLSRAGEAAEDPDVAVDPAGNAVVLWSRTDGSPRVIEAAAKQLGGPWSGPEPISVVGLSAAEPRVAIDPAGNRVAVWSRFDGAKKIVQAAGFDGGGPLQSVSIPSAGTVRQPLSFAVSLFDVWSAIGPVGWSFGDGEGAAGTAAAHAYPRPGTYQVTVSGSDELGHMTTTSTALRIYPKPRVGRNVIVRRGGARLRLYCPSPAGCQGSIRLVAPTSIKQNGRPKGSRRQIGKASFSVPGARTSVVIVRLTRKGKAAVGATGRKGLKAQLTGPGAKHRIVVLYKRSRR